MKNVFAIIAILSSSIFALNDVSLPYSFTPKDTIKASKFNANYDTLKNRINQTNDSLEQKFIRFYDLESGDSLLDKVRIDTARIDFIRSNPNADSITITKADINGGTIDGTVIGGSSAAAGSFTTVTALGAISGTTLNTGNGTNELYPMDQDVRTTASVTHSGLTLTGNATFAGNANFGTKPANDLWWDLAIGPRFTFYNENNSGQIGNNFYLTGGKYYRRQAYGAAWISLGYGGSIELSGAPSGAEGSEIASWYRYFTGVDGKVGINNTSPTEKLDVVGNIKVSDSLLIGATNAFNLYGGWYREGWYLCTLGGFTTTVRDTVRYVKIGNQVTLTFCSATGTRNTAGIMSLSTGAMPSFIKPLRPIYVNITNAGIDGLSTDAEMVIAPPSTFRMATFNGSGTGGFANSKCVTYSLQ